MTSKNRKIAIISAVALAILFVLPVSYFVSRHLAKSDTRADAGRIKSAQTSARFLSSYYANGSLYEGLFDVPVISKESGVMAGIVPHHFLAKSLIAGFFSKIDFSDISRVIIVSPDHYWRLGTSQPVVATSELDWKTPWGPMRADAGYIGNIQQNIPEIKMDDGLFFGEHGIYTLVPFVGKVAPQEKIVPLIVSSADDFDAFFAIGEKLRAEDGKNGGRTLLIVSSDFSHHATVSEAEKQDKASREAIESQEPGNISAIRSDCRNCIAMLEGFLGNKKHTTADVRMLDSSDFGDDIRSKDITSYVSMYFLQ